MPDKFNSKIAILLASFLLFTAFNSAQALEDGTPIYVLAGQSNAARLSTHGSFDASLTEAGLDGITIHEAHAGTRLAVHDDRLDWYPFDDGNEQSGELFQSLIDSIDSAMSQDESAYIDSILWIQGENDVIDNTYDEYETNLEQFVVRLRDTFGSDFVIYIVQLAQDMPVASYNAWVPGWQPVIQAQNAIAEKYSFVRLIDPAIAFENAGVDFEEGVADTLHYNPTGSRVIADAYTTNLELLSASKAGEFGGAHFWGHFPVGHDGAELIPDDNIWGSFHYTNVWPLVAPDEVRRYYQSGLPGTWLTLNPDEGSGAFEEAIAEFEGANPGEEHDLTVGYTTMEGGVGLWGNTKFISSGQKYIMGGVAAGFGSIANGVSQGSPSWSRGGWEANIGRYAVAQLSNRALFPLDHLNIENDTVNEMFGYGMYPLPLTERMDTLDGTDTPTGNHSWTLFLNTENFKGPLAFFQPTFWSRRTIGFPHRHGELFDNNLLNTRRAASMETLSIPALHWNDANGDIYYRITDTYFPLDQKTVTVVNTDGTTEERRTGSIYSSLISPNRSKWNEVENWFNGLSGVASTDFQSSDIYTKNIANVGPRDITWKVKGTDSDRATENNYWIETETFTSRIADNNDPAESAIAWGDMATPVGDNLVRLPRYWKWPSDASRVHAVDEIDVPETSGLAAVNSVDDMGEFYDVRGRDTSALATPMHPDYSGTSDIEMAWRTPGPTHGPHYQSLGDGSTVTYYWYKFNEQPAVVNSGFPQDQRDVMQTRVELIQQHWGHEATYFPDPDHQLASLDPGLIVTPPSGLEVGYVPIVVHQQLSSEEQPDFPVIDKVSVVEPAVATLYINDSLTGASHGLTVGSYPRLTDLGVTNDQISAVRVESDYAVELFENFGFGGESILITADSDPKLVLENFDNRASSAKIYPYTADTTESEVVKNEETVDEVVDAADNEGNGDADNSVDSDVDADTDTDTDSETEADADENTDPVIIVGNGSTSLLTLLLLSVALGYRHSRSRKMVNRL